VVFETASKKASLTLIIVRPMGLVVAGHSTLDEQ
jgi:hypothetical protein